MGIAVFFSELERKGLFGIGTAVIAKNFIADIRAECGRVRSRFKKSYLRRNRFVQPVIGTEMRTCRAGVGPFFVNAGIRVKKLVRVRRDKRRRNRRSLFKHISAR